MSPNVHPFPQALVPPTRNLRNTNNISTIPCQATCPPDMSPGKGKLSQSSQND